MGKQEDAIVERIRSLFPQSASEIGIGDDAAVIHPDGAVVITNDLLIENVDFTDRIPLKFVAEKSLAVNLSDLAAMGATPTHFVLAVGVPRDRLPWLEMFFTALAEASRRYGIRLIGGDLSAASELVISITAFGRLAGPRPLLRSNAKAGQRIYVSRPLGGSASGLALLGKEWQVGDTITAPSGNQVGYAQLEFGSGAIRQHVAPAPEMKLGAALALLDGIGAVIDVSDGLSTDLHRICNASNVGAEIEWERVPLFPDLHSVGRSLGINVEEVALHGGEEFALLFTSDRRESELSGALGRPVYNIGRVTAGREVVLMRNGHCVPLGDYGFDHFA